jgi:hypothetical protein
MTNQQFLDNFYVLYDEVSDLSAPGYTPLELSKIASEVQEDLIITNYGPKSNKLQEGFEETEKRIQDLGELVRYKSYTTFSPAFFSNSTYVELPNTLITVGPTDYSDVYWFTIYENAVSNQLDCTIPSNTTRYVEPKVVDVTHGELKVAVKDPFRKPYILANDGKVLRLRSEGRKHILITDGTFTVTRYDVGYIRKPLPIDLVTNLTAEVSELSDHKQRELLRKTVERCLGITDQVQKLNVDLQLPKE